MSELRRSGLLFVLALVVVGCSSSSNDGIIGTRDVLGNGMIVEQTRQFSGITAVVHWSEGALRIEQVQSGPETLRIVADENLLQHIITEVQGGVLEIRTETGIDMDPTQVIEFHLAVVDLEGATLSGVGSVVASSFSVDDLLLTLQGVGSMECADLDAGSLTVVRSGTGLVGCSGRVDQQALTLDGIGDYEAPDLLGAREATLSVGSGTSATVKVSERLTATVVSGSVSYIDASGGGLIVNCTPSDHCRAL